MSVLGGAVGPTTVMQSPLLFSLHDFACSSPHLSSFLLPGTLLLLAYLLKQVQALGLLQVRVRALVQAQAQVRG